MTAFLARCRAAGTWGTVAIVVALWVVPAVGAPAGAVEPEVGCSVSQLTDGVYDEGEGIMQVAISSDGTTVVFVSNADFDGSNPDGEVALFRVDVASRAVARVAHDLRIDPYHLVFSGDLMKVAFITGLDLTGENADGNTEVFLYDLATSTLTQVTDTVGGDLPMHWGWVYAHESPLLNGDGSRVFFNSTLNHGPGDPARGGYWMAEVATGAFTRVVGTPGRPTPGRYGVAVDGRGSRLVFEAGRQAYLLDLEAGTTVGLADGRPSSDASDPQLSEDGTTVIYQSRGDPVGRNPGGVLQVFARDVASGEITQLLPSRRDGGAARPDSTARRLVVPSNAEHFGGTNRALGLFDRASSSLVRIPGGQYAYDRSIDGDGNQVVYGSRQDLSGDNPDGDHEIFLFDCTGRTLPDYHRPDLWLRGPGQRSFLGQDTYNAAGGAQTLRLGVRPGTTARFTWRIENDGSVADEFRVTGYGGSQRLSVRYFDGPTDVTAAVIGDGHDVGPLGRGESAKIRMEATVRRRAAIGSAWHLSVAVRSDVGTLVTDRGNVRISAVR